MSQGFKKDYFSLKLIGFQTLRPYLKGYFRRSVGKLLERLLEIIGDNLWNIQEILSDCLWNPGGIPLNLREIFRGTFLIGSHLGDHLELWGTSGSSFCETVASPRQFGLESRPRAVETDRQTNRQRNRQSDRQTDRQTDKHRLTNRQTDRQTDRRTDEAKP